MGKEENTRRDGRVEVLVFDCPNPRCGQTLRVKRPSLPGVYRLRCSCCGTIKKVRMKGNEPQLQQSQQPPQPRKVHPVEVVAGEVTRFACPTCGVTLGVSPTKPGASKAECPRCHTSVPIVARGRTQILSPDSVFESEKELCPPLGGRLIMLRRGWLNRDFPLAPGRHTVGRADPREPSDISVTDDAAMSRRSVAIDIFPSPEGLMFRLTVLRATNPVVHNGEPLKPGESVSLNFGDTLVLGRTRFRFDKEKN